MDDDGKFHFRYLRDGASVLDGGISMSALASSGEHGDYPLAGVRVVEFAHVAAGPFAGMLLADLGADVVKVEPPTGDQMRFWPPLAYDDEGEHFSHNFASLNRNKRSIVADLKEPEQFTRVRKLCESANVILENYRPGALTRLGLGFEELARTHKGVVYCSISGYGLGSPHAERGAYDVVIQGMSGLMSVTGEPGGQPVKCGVPVADFIAGLYAAYTISAILPKVRADGQSVHIDCPMLDCLLATSALQTSEYWGTGQPPGKFGSAHSRNAPYQAFTASDGNFVIAAGNDRYWREVCAATSLETLQDDPRFREQLDRVANQEELAALLGARFVQEPVDYWLDVFGRHGVPCGPINDFADILNDQHVHMTGLVQHMQMPVAGPTPTVVFPVRISGMDSRLNRGPPGLGADTNDVYDDWGVDG